MPCRALHVHSTRTGSMSFRRGESRPRAAAVVTTHEARIVEDCISQRRYDDAVRMHPLFDDMRDFVVCAMHRVAMIRMHDGTSLTDVIPGLRGNMGSMIGTLFEHSLLQVIREQYDDEYRAQKKRSDCDILSTDDRIFNFEIKTTTSPREIYGNRIVSQAKASGSFLLAVNYSKLTLDVTRVRFGWVDPTCWAGQAGNGQQARLTAVARDTRLQDCT